MGGRGEEEGEGEERKREREFREVRQFFVRTTRRRCDRLRSRDNIADKELISCCFHSVVFPSTFLGNLTNLYRSRSTASTRRIASKGKYKLGLGRLVEDCSSFFRLVFLAL